MARSGWPGKQGRFKSQVAGCGDPNTRRLVQLTIDDEDDQRTDAMMDMLLAKKRSEDRRNWLQEKGDMAEIEV
ncbi:DNA topoisomerase IV [Escherichia coli]|nr:DNA topoisomerase IV [Escherichia coli]